MPNDDHKTQKQKALPCVIECGGWLVKLRHSVEDSGNEDVKEIDDTIAKLLASINDPDLRAAGFLKMHYAKALTILNEMRAEAITRQWRVMQAHDSLRDALVQCNLAQPTDLEISRVIGVLNRR